MKEKLVSSFIFLCLPLLLIFKTEGFFELVSAKTSEYFLNEGESIEVNGESLSLVKVGTFSVLIEIGGIEKIIKEGDKKIIRDIEIQVENVSYVEKSALLILKYPITTTTSPLGGGMGGPTISPPSVNISVGEYSKISEFLVYEGKSIEVGGKNINVIEIDEHGHQVLIDVEGYKDKITEGSRRILDDVGVEVKEINLTNKSVLLSITYPLTDLIEEISISPHDGDVVTGLINVSIYATSPYRIGEIILTIQNKNRTLKVPLTECSEGGTGGYCPDCVGNIHKHCVYEWNTQEFLGDVVLKIDVTDILGKKRSKIERLKVTHLSCEKYCQKIGYSSGSCKKNCNKNEKAIGLYLCPKYCPPCELKKNGVILNVNGTRYVLNEGENITVGEATLILKSVINKTFAIFGFNNTSLVIESGKVRIMNDIEILLVDILYEEGPKLICPECYNVLCCCNLETTTSTTTTVIAGNEYLLMVGESVIVDEKNITLIDIGTSTILVNVDGVMKIINENERKTVNGIEITVEDIFYNRVREERGALLSISKTTTTTTGFSGGGRGGPVTTSIILHCGNGICERNEDCKSCNLDCACSEDFTCKPDSKLADENGCVHMKPLDYCIYECSERYPIFLCRISCGIVCALDLC